MGGWRRRGCRRRLEEEGVTEVARADLLVKLVSAGSRGDAALFRRTVEAIIAEERSKRHHVLADRLAEGLKASNGPAGMVSAVNRKKVADLICETRPERALEDLILPEGVVRVCRELVEEHRRRDLLLSYNLEPRHRVLLVGPPGNESGGATGRAEFRGGRRIRTGHTAAICPVFAQCRSAQHRAGKAGAAPEQGPPGG